MYHCSREYPTTKPNGISDISYWSIQVKSPTEFAQWRPHFRLTERHDGGRSGEQKLQAHCALVQLLIPRAECRRQTARPLGPGGALRSGVEGRNATEFYVGRSLHVLYGHPTSDGPANYERCFCRVVCRARSCRFVGCL